jgi:lysophospholipase L1-like esterase
MTDTAHTSAHDEWVRSWAAAPQGADPDFGTVVNATLRQAVRISSGGSHVRVRFSNEFGRTGLTIGAAHVGIAGPDGGVLPGSDRTLTFADSPTAFVPAGAPSISDPVALPVPAFSTLIVSIYVPGRVESVTCHNLVAGPGWIVPGDQTAAADLPADAQPLPARALLSAVETLSDATTSGIVAIGDSITDGAGATPGTNGGWPELLAARFATGDTAQAAVANEGISGNRLLNDGFGASALARFDRDVLATPGLTHVIVSEGINDIAFSIAPGDVDPEFAKIMRTDVPVDAEDVLAAYRQMIRRAHVRGAKLLGATLTPYRGSDLFTPEGEAARQRINDWVRTSRAFDAILDFDAVWRDPDQPDRIKDGFHAGDYLHGSDAGYKALADSVDLALFD